jgi:hypothetical protein
MGLDGDRARARELGIEPGVLPPGPLNAIADVSSVRLGHVTFRNLPRLVRRACVCSLSDVPNDKMSPLFRSTSVIGHRGHTAQPLPPGQVLALPHPSPSTELKPGFDEGPRAG